MSMQRFTFERLRGRLQQYQPPLNSAVDKKASVLIPLFEKEGEVYVWLTRRSKHLSSHAGQVSFPGGRQDPEDSSALDAALRECREEIGLRAEAVEVLGRIDQIISINYYLVTPFVAKVPDDFEPVPSEDEIESVFCLPVSFFSYENNHHSNERSKGPIPHISHHFHYENYEIWGLTAMLMIRLLEAGFGFKPPYKVNHPDAPDWVQMAQWYKGERIWHGEIPEKLRMIIDERRLVREKDGQSIG